MAAWSICIVTTGFVIYVLLTFVIFLVRYEHFMNIPTVRESMNPAALSQFSGPTNPVESNEPELNP